MLACALIQTCVCVCVCVCVCACVRLHVYVYIALLGSAYTSVRMMRAC